jgi:hypothetical protein
MPSLLDVIYPQYGSSTPREVRPKGSQGPKRLPRPPLTYRPSKRRVIGLSAWRFPFLLRQIADRDDGRRGYERADECRLSGRKKTAADCPGASDDFIASLVVDSIACTVSDEVPLAAATAAAPALSLRKLHRCDYHSSNNSRTIRP